MLAGQHQTQPCFVDNFYKAYFKVSGIRKIKNGLQFFFFLRNAGETFLKVPFRQEGNVDFLQSNL